MTNKMEIELTDEQLDKVKLLEAHGISVGEGIDMLFEARDKAMSIISEINANLPENAAPDEEPKEEKAEEPEHAAKTYDEAVQDYKHHVSWAKDFFKI